MPHVQAEDQESHWDNSVQILRLRTWGLWYKYHMCRVRRPEDSGGGDDHRAEEFGYLSSRRQILPFLPPFPFKVFSILNEQH